jgi:hypothetical protein
LEVVVVTPPVGLSLEVAERQLDRIQSFFPRIDSRVPALFAVGVGQVAIATLNLNASNINEWWVALPGAFFLVGMAIVGWNLYRCAFPHLAGGIRSLVYFNEIAKLSEGHFLERYSTVSEADYRRDVISQIWRNSEIVALKFGYIRTATQFTMVSFVPWLILMICTAVSSGKMPALS